MTHRFRLFTFLLIVCNVFCLANVANAAGDTNDPLAKKSIFETLSREEPLEITIVTNLSILIENRRTEDYLTATLTYKDAQGKEIKRAIEVQPRGKFRRRVCDFPPVRIKFAKKDLESEGLEKDFNKLKLVTHCLDDKLIGNDNLLKEYLIYQLYNTLNPNSYHAQLVKVTYIDTEGNEAKTKRYGILLEDTDELAQRLGGQEIETMNVSKDSISMKDEASMAMFQYMIGNTDWTTEMLRNVKMILPTGSTKMIPVPYDFDFSGFVNASYAIPQNDKGIVAIGDRVYFGAFQDQALLRETLAHFIQQKETLLKTVKEFKLLSLDARKEALAYLESFYTSVEPAYANANIELASFLKMRNATVDTWKQEQTAASSIGSANK